MNRVTMELIQLQTICLAYDETIIDSSGNYKRTPEAIKALSNAWNKADKNTKNTKDNIVKLIGLGE